MTKQLLASYVVFICIAICLLGVVLWQHEKRGSRLKAKKAYEHKVIQCTHVVPKGAWDGSESTPCLPMKKPCRGTRVIRRPRRDEAHEHEREHAGDHRRMPRSFSI